MSALQLLTYIVAALLIQLAAGLGLVWFRRRSTPRVGSGQVVESVSRHAVGAWVGWRAFRVTRREFEDRSQTQCSVYLEPVDGVALPMFRPGQFLTFSLSVAAHQTGEQEGQQVITRCYSLSDRPNPRSYRVTVKRVLLGLASNHFHDSVHVGDIVQVKAPAGQFVMDTDAAVPAVLIAGGVGITPMMSMLRWCLSEQPERVVHLYYGLRNGQEHAFKAELERLASAHANFHLTVVYSAAHATDMEGCDFQHQGHVNMDLLRRTLPHGRHQFYICGPTAMMDSVVAALSDWGVPAQDIHFERFGPSSTPAADSSALQDTTLHAESFEIGFKQSARTLTWDGQDANLLDFAERHGLLVESACRSGVCGSCEVRLISGEVRYARQPDYEVGSGRCLLCVGRPASDLMMEA
ncbi:MAG: 2Fe-2S iron-sulfur cluster-binding protein [Aquabacterium sp.]|nr:2Fe-2S iron-sulfur cluster-binding protein [Aquabacterium sp.]